MTLKTFSQNLYRKRVDYKFKRFGRRNTRINRPITQIEGRM